MEEAASTRGMTCSTRWRDTGPHGPPEMPLLTEGVRADGGHGLEGSASLMISPHKTLGGEEEIHLCKITLVHHRTTERTGETALK